MQTAMVPTVGRNVYFEPGEGQHSQNGKVVQFAGDADAPQSTQQPLLGFVCYVHSDELVNLLVIDHTGNGHSLTSVPFIPAGVPVPKDGPYAYWMPYQVGQHRAQTVPQEPPPEQRRVEPDDANTGIGGEVVDAEVTR